MKGKSLSLLIGFVIGTALAGTAQKPPVRRHFKASNPSLEKQGLPVPYSDAVLVGNTMYLAGRTGSDPKSGAIPQDVVMVQVTVRTFPCIANSTPFTSLTFRRNFLQGRSWGPGRYWAEHISRCWESR